MASLLGFDEESIFLYSFRGLPARSRFGKGRDAIPFVKYHPFLQRLRVLGQFFFIHPRPLLTNKEGSDLSDDWKDYLKEE
ncbi:MAG: hypothetical protein K8S00_11795 [Bacteroidales bacterium]|nr:hypothetical protein [Bacteroidales bacterium]